jgi:hypothetical protein
MMQGHARNDQATRQVFAPVRIVSTAAPIPFGTIGV